MTLVASFVFALFLPLPAEAQTALPAEAGRVFDLVNDTRADHGLTPLARSRALDEIALSQTARMVEAGDIFHNPDLSGDLNATGLDWLFTGENVGVGPDAVTIHDAFVASLHHYENIVKPDFDRIGVGVLSRPGGGVYVTHVFAQVTPTSAPATPVRETPVPTATAPPPTPLRTPAPTPVPATPKVVAIEGGIVAMGQPL